MGYTVNGLKDRMIFVMIFKGWHDCLNESRQKYNWYDDVRIGKVFDSIVRQT